MAILMSSKVISTIQRSCYSLASIKSHIYSKCPCTLNEMMQWTKVIPDFITFDEENKLLKELEVPLKRMRYQSGHWDKAIESYRELEKSTWNDNDNDKLINRIRDYVFPPDQVENGFITKPLSCVHVLDLSDEGEIKAHVDAIRFCGPRLAGLSLMSHSVMRLVSVTDSNKSVDLYLPRRSLYIICDAARYDYTHAILPQKDTFFNGQPVIKGRRISIILRCEPNV